MSIDGSHESVLPEAEKKNWVSTKIGKLVAGTVLTLEINPFTSEVARLALLGATLKVTGDPMLSAAVYGGSTLAQEVTAGVVTADVLDTTGSNRAVGKVNQGLDKIGASRILNTNIATEAAVAIYAGTPAVTFLKHRQNPERTRQQNRRYAVGVSLGISAVCAAEGYAIAEGLDNPDPLKLSIAALGVGGIIASYKWARKRISSAQVQDISSLSENEMIEQGLDSVYSKLVKESNEGTQVDIRYDLSDEELAALEQDLVSDVKEHFEEEGMYAAWIRPSHRYANIVRTNEAKYFPEVEDVSIAEENRTLLLALVDTRASANRVVHSATVSGISYDENIETVIDRPESKDDTTGFIVVDQLVDMGNFTRQEFFDYYAAQGIDTSKSIAVETNLRIGSKAERFNGLRTAQLAYIAIFERLNKRNPEMHKSAVFTTINRPSILSFKQFGLEYEPLMGRSDLTTPESELGEDFLPVAIPYNEHNLAVFKAAGEGLPEISF